jgi:uncharacterized membrane protein YwzB
LQKNLSLIAIKKRKDIQRILKIIIKIKLNEAVFTYFLNTKLKYSTGYKNEKEPDFKTRLFLYKTKR